MKKYLSLFLIFIITTYSLLGTSLSAAAPLPPAPPQASQTPQTPPPPPPLPQAPEAPAAPVYPTPTPIPTSPPSPTPTPSPTPSETTIPQPEESNTSPQPIQPPTYSGNDPSNIGNGADSTNSATATISDTSTIGQSNLAEVTNSLTATSNTGNNTAGGNVGNSIITTGDSSLLATIETDVNQNSILPSPTTGNTSPLLVSNQKNGSDSTNTASLTQTDSDLSQQGNIAAINNQINLKSESGNNDASKNVGDTAIITGNANLGTTIITAANTNLNGVGIAEFNVNDNHTGDIVLAFPQKNCSVTICGAPVSGDITNTGNGSNSTNTSNLDTSSSSVTNQSNSADVDNNLVFTANSGTNSADKNTGGDTHIQTGDANIAANVISMLNNNIAGPSTPVLFGVVNIFGNLVGDIILPSVDSERNTSVDNNGNGSGSANTSTYSSSSVDNLSQSNLANINNKVSIDANTGNNTTDKNTYEFGQGAVLETGDAAIDANIINIANNNVSGDTWWVVMVNNAGQWMGKIIGAQPEATYAGSSGTEFILDGSGNVIAVANTNNGADSVNSAGAVTSYTSNITQSNVANLNNNIKVSANTGNNSASKNTDGNSSITTGEANVVLNVFNFVNNNFTGGKFVFTVVNVFGSWVGDVVTPGQQKQSTARTTPEQPSSIDGPSTQTSPQPDGHAASTETRSNTSTSTTTTTNQPPSLASVSQIKSVPQNQKPRRLVLGILSSLKITPLTNVYEDNTIQVSKSSPISLGSRLDTRWLYLSLAASLLLFLIRRPGLLRKIGTFLGLL